MSPNIIWLESVDSTNTEAKRRIDVLPDMSVIAANKQTAGRGQRENIWLSAPGLNLTFSIVLKHDGSFLNSLKPENQQVISEMISSTMINLLSTYGVDAHIKLPNDIYVGNKKICGILIEHAVRGDSILHSIIGVGMNVNQTVFDDSLPNPTSLALEIGHDMINLQTLLQELLDLFETEIKKSVQD
jgi:BirA family biotin operon repressor/biotin-[acetyl-CoA-carboxylase] ligase